MLFDLAAVFLQVLHRRCCLCRHLFFRSCVIASLAAFQKGESSANPSSPRPVRFTAIPNRLDLNIDEGVFASDFFFADCFVLLGVGAGLVLCEDRSLGDVDLGEDSSLLVVFNFKLLGIFFPSFPKEYRGMNTRPLMNARSRGVSGLNAAVKRSCRSEKGYRRDSGG